MESRSDNLEDKKNKIMQFIKVRGPSIPIKFCQQLGVDSLLASAFLSELLSEKKLKISSMKIGNSPLYYIPGQELQLEKFVSHLGRIEGKAFEILKNSGVVDDSKVEPAIRVALRSLKDFAFAFQYQGKLYWRFLRLPEQKAIEMLERKYSPQSPQLVERGLDVGFEKEQPVQRGIQVEKKQTEFVDESLTKHPQPPTLKRSNKQTEPPLLVLKNKLFNKLSKPKKPQGKEKSDFVFDVVEFLKDNQFILDEEVGFKKKEYLAKVKVDSQLGKMNLFCIAKDKKTITENDLNLALQKSQDEKMPVLLLCPGEPNKKAAAKLDELKSLVFYKRLG